MDKWEFLEFLCDWPNRRIEFRTNIPAEQFSNQIPGCNVHIKNSYQGRVELGLKDASFLNIFINNVLEFLGNQGWEAYAYSSNVKDYYQYAFKRKKHDF